MIMEKYSISAEAEFIVEFNEVDPMHVVWHGNYINYFEKARRTLFDKIGYGYKEMKESGYAFPVTAVSAKYIKSLRLGDRAIVKAVLGEYENCIKISFVIINAANGDVCTKGTSTQMTFDITANTSRFTCPDIFIDKVEVLLKKGENNK
jgi:acyl-CoA thioester hydrolase